MRRPSNLTLGSSMNGACVMFSMPPATATSTSPVRMSWAAMLIASRPDEHCRLTAMVGVDSGMPALSEASRAAYPASWAWSAFPSTTSSTISGDTPARSSAALIAAAPRSEAATSLKEPPNLPIGVLAPLTITAFCITYISLYVWILFWPIIRLSTSEWRGGVGAVREPPLQGVRARRPRSAAWSNRHTQARSACKVVQRGL